MRCLSHEGALRAGDGDGGDGLRVHEQRLDAGAEAVAHRLHLRRHQPHYVRHDADCRSWVLRRLSGLQSRENFRFCDALEKMGSRFAVHFLDRVSLLRPLQCHCIQ